ncbi:NAD-dependent epimerase/dehydratase family protein [Chondromyces apiculatus]|uniref:NAD-dependent epimerase/dehydratase n=1 Tax=Chondromyces apiculatus DSM 436 TaxID=1192034 RepID=A0A017T965_9BACT|nr:NAD-dependent epimerase/dehydratase family protein [Chondromyces apiculatus]EYF05360.1 NAD-dependent epimerase/dehydratase [Chondromyces apiculatus DSM 436]
MSRIFITGASGYIGGSVAAHLRKDGHEIVALVRSPEGAARLEAAGLRPQLGGLDDGPLLSRLASEADLVINTADSDHRGAIEALLAPLRGTGKLFIHTSGSSIVADDADGRHPGAIYDEGTPFTPVPLKVARVAIDTFVRDAARDNVRSVVICPTMIYGRGTGVKPDSIQVPLLLRLSRERGAGVHVGPGQNIWSNVHIEDLADLYALAVARAEPGAFFFAENGEAKLEDIAQALSRILGFGGRTVAVPIEEAIKAFGEDAARYGLASNSRVRAIRAREDLGWRPHRPSLLDDIENGSYRASLG